MKISKKPGLSGLQSLSYDEMRAIKGGYSGSCYINYVCISGCVYNGSCSSCCWA